MKDVGYPLQFLAIIENSASVLEVEELFFNLLKNNSRYQKLCSEECSYLPDEHDTFWNVNDSSLNSDLRLNQKKFSKYYMELDMPVFYAYFNCSFCLLLINGWDLFLRKNKYYNDITSIIEDIIIGLSTTNKECVFVATDEEEDYPILEKYILSINRISKFESIKEIKDFFDITGVHEIRNSLNLNAGYVCKNWE